MKTIICVADGGASLRIGGFLATALRPVGPDLPVISSVLLPSLSLLASCLFGCLAWLRNAKQLLDPS